MNKELNEVFLKSYTVNFEINIKSNLVNICLIRETKVAEVNNSLIFLLYKSYRFLFIESFSIIILTLHISTLPNLNQYSSHCTMIKDLIKINEHCT